MSYKQAIVKIMLLSTLFQTAFSGVQFKGVGGSWNFDQTNSSLNVGEAITGFNGILKIKTSAGAGDNVLGANNIGFDGGILQLHDISGAPADIKSSSSYLKGSYIPGATTVADTITLSNGDYIEVFSGDNVPQAITIAASSSATINGATLFGTSITLAAASSTLNLGLQHKLASDITLGGGKVVLLNDLSLKDGVRLTGNGTADLALHSLAIGASSSAWAGNITFQRAQDIQLNGNVDLTGVWTFETNGGITESVINGNGNILNFSAASGSIAVTGAHTLHLVDVHIKGLGDSHGSFDMSANTSKITLSNVTIELASNYTHSMGTIQAVGDSCRVISGGTKTFTITSANATLNVDSVALYYETLGGPNVSPFIATGGGLMSYTDRGVIRSALSNTQPADIVIDAVAEVTRYINGSLDLTSASKIVVENAASPTSHAVTIDGKGYTWKMPASVSSAVITVADDAVVTLQNVVIDNYQPAGIGLTGDAILYFGSGVVLNCTQDIAVAAGKLNCNGNVLVRGNGKRIALSAANSILQTKENMALTIHNAELFISNSTSLGCGTLVPANLHTDKPYNGKIILQDTLLTLLAANGATGLSFVSGNMDIKGSSKIVGVPSSTVDGYVSFDWVSNGTLTIHDTLELGNKLNFKYMPDFTVNAENPESASVQRRKVKLQDDYSVLKCDNCKLTATGKPWALDVGNLIIDNSVSLIADTLEANAVELKAALTVEILAAGLLTVDGAVKYVA